MNKKKDKVIAVFILIIMLMNMLSGIISADFETQVEDTNVFFDVYFDNESHNTEANINEQTMLTANIKIENAGVIDNAKIKFDNPNFKINADDIDQKYIKEVNKETDEITLSQITTGEISIKIPIIFEKYGKIDISELSKATPIKFTGDYKCHSEEIRQIEKNMEIVVNWVSSPTIELQSEYTSYFSDNSQVILEQTITSTDNDKMPKQAERIEVQIPILDEQKPLQTKVLIDDMIANEEYKIEENNLIIENTNDLWEKNQDKYTIIYTYPETVELKEREIPQNIQCKTRFYGKSEIAETQKNETEIVQEKGQAIQTQYTSTESVYKGYIQNAAERNTTIDEVTQIKFLKTEKTIKEIEMGTTSLVDENENQYPIENVQYEKTLLNKKQLKSVLGENFVLTFINQETNELIATIDSNTKEDEQGNITIEYEDNIHKIKIQTENEVKNEGKITIANVKNIIGNTGYTKEQIKQFKQINNEEKIKEIDDTQTEIAVQTELKDTETKAELKISTEQLISSQTNENVEIEVNLLSYNIMHELYKNPLIEVNLPKEIQDINVKSIKKVYSDELSVQDAALITNDQGQKVIQIQMAGEETQYNNSTFKGATIKILCDIDLKNKEQLEEEYKQEQQNQSLEENQLQEQIENATQEEQPETQIYTSQIQVKCTNENSNQQYEEQKEVKILALEEPKQEVQQPVEENMTEIQQTSTTEEQEVEEHTNEKITMEVLPKTNGEQLKDGEDVYEGQNIFYQLKIKNVSENDIQNAKIAVTHENAIFYHNVRTEVEVTDEDTESNYEDIYEEDPELKQLDIDIGTIKAGETIEKQYEISVAEVEEEGQLSGNIVVTATDMENLEVETNKNPIKQADLKLVMSINNFSNKREYYSDQSLEIRLSLTNFTDEQKDADIYIPLPEGISSQERQGEEDENFEYLGVENGMLHVKINNIRAKQVRNTSVKLWIDEFEDESDKKQFEFYAILKLNEEVNLRTNFEIIEVARLREQDVPLQVNLISTPDNNTEVSTGQQITYTGIVRNYGLQDIENIEIAIQKTENIIIDSITIEGAVDQETQDYGENFIISKIAKNSTATITIQAHITEDEQAVTTQELYDTSLYFNVKTEEYELMSPEINHEIVIDNQGTQDNPWYEYPVSNGKISGTAWIDSNKDGIKDEGEERIPNLEIVLINAFEDEQEVMYSTITDEQGNYEFSDLIEGNYIIGFNYDNVNYQMTEYQKQGVSERQNSDVITEYSSDGKLYAITDIINVSEKYVTNIDAGFIQKDLFDLSMKKYISRVTIRDNKNNVTTTNYQNTQFTKQEIPSKTLEGAVVLIDYDIVITNEGELPGFIDDITDYIPADLQFQSSVNKDWYLGTDGNLHTNSLSQEIIQPGETKTITLVLTKQMTKTNVGMISNTAEISAAHNERNSQDKDSILGNRQDGEDDISNAQLLVSVKTGLVQSVNITVIITVLLAIAMIIYIIRGKEDDESEDKT